MGRYPPPGPAGEACKLSTQRCKCQLYKIDLKEAWVVKSMLLVENIDCKLFGVPKFIRLTCHGRSAPRFGVLERNDGSNWGVSKVCSAVIPPINDGCYCNWQNSCHHLASGNSHSQPPNERNTPHELLSIIHARESVIRDLLPQEIA